MPTTTNNMGLKIPTAGETDYATSVSDSFTAIDQHDHSSAKGTQIVTAGIADAAVTTAKLANGILANSSAGRGKMADGFLSADAEGRGKMADGFLTPAKKAALGQQITAAATFTTTSTTEVDVTGLSQALDAVGRPAFIGLTAGIAGGQISIGTSFSEDNAAAFVYIYEDSTLIGSFPIRFDTGAGAVVDFRIPPSSIWMLHTPTTGSKTYKITAKVAGANMTLTFTDCKLAVYPL